MAWCKSGTRTPGLGTWDPPQSLKVGPQDSFQNLKVGLQDYHQSLKVGPLHLSLMNSFFSEYFIVFFIFESFLNKIYTKKISTVSNRNQ